MTFPVLEKHVNLIEGVQRRATKLVPKFRDLDYEDRLKRLRLPSLKYRRFRGDIIETYKYTHNLYKLTNSPIKLDTSNINTRGHSFKLKKSSCNKNIRSKFFTERVVNSWNSLPEDIVNAPTLNALKNRIDKFYKDTMYSITTDFHRPPHRH